MDWKVEGLESRVLKVIVGVLPYVLSAQCVWVHVPSIIFQQKHKTEAPSKLPNGAISLLELNTSIHL